MCASPSNHSRCVCRGPSQPMQSLTVCVCGRHPAHAIPYGDCAIPPHTRSLCVRRPSPCNPSWCVRRRAFQSMQSLTGCVRGRRPSSCHPLRWLCGRRPTPCCVRERRPSPCNNVRRRHPSPCDSSQCMCAGIIPAHAIPHDVCTDVIPPRAILTECVGDVCKNRFYFLLLFRERFFSIVIIYKAHTTLGVGRDTFFDRSSMRYVGKGPNSG